MESDSSHLSHEEFFSRLGSLFASHQTQERDSIYLTQKRLSPPSPSSSSSTQEHHDSLTDLHVEQPLPVLIRATNGKSQHPGQSATKKAKGKGGKISKASKTRKEGKIKLSTVVQPDELDSFFARYAECAKTGMSAGLKKRDRRANRRKKDKKKEKPSSSAPHA